MCCLRPSGSMYCSDSSVALRLLAFRKNVFCPSPTYDSVVVTVVRLEASVPTSGHSSFFLQLQLGSLFWFEVVATFESIWFFFLSDAMMVFMFGMHE